MKRLQTLVEWATSAECRRKGLLAYFGEHYEEQNCGMCDNCRQTEMERVDLTGPARKFLSSVIETKEIFGVEHIINVLLGSKVKKVVKNRHHQLPAYGTGREYNKTQWKHLALQFLQHGLLKRDAQYGSLRLTNDGRAVFRGETQFIGFPVNPIDHITEEPTTSNVTSEKTASYVHELFEQLRTKRKELADAERVPSFVVFHDRTLREMVVQLPQSVEAFRQVPGVGPVKVKKYADVFLPIICAYCQKTQVDGRKAFQRRKKERSRTYISDPILTTKPRDDSTVAVEITPDVIDREFTQDSFPHRLLTELARSDEDARQCQSLNDRLDAINARMAIHEKDNRDWSFAESEVARIEALLPGWAKEKRERAGFRTRNGHKKGREKSITKTIRAS